MEKHVKELESQIAVEKKIMAGAECIIREYSTQKKVDKKALANAEATLAQSKDKVDELTDELARFKITDTSPSAFAGRPLKREMSVSGKGPGILPKVEAPLTLLSLLFFKTSTRWRPSRLLMCQAEFRGSWRKLRLR